MSITRRTALQTLAAAGATAVLPTGLGAREAKRPSAEAVGILYDPTRCIGCKQCIVGCAEANGCDAELATADDAVLTTRSLTVLERYFVDGQETCLKAQCMHCVDPACASVCMIGAFKKGRNGVVSYDPAKCVGCRYCQIACPFNIPKYEWNTPFPKIVKCEMCRNRLAEGKLPACVEACPREAVIFGGLEDLKANARRRLAAEPGRYYPKVYGETDGGGTQVLYLSAAGIPFEKLGLPDLGDKPVPELSETLQHAIYRGFIAPVVLYGALGVVIYRNRKKPSGEEEGEE
jgi:Fe-S-cluster-containing dehydrogenase component